MLFNLKICHRDWNKKSNSLKIKQDINKSNENEESKNEGEIRKLLKRKK